MRISIAPQPSVAFHRERCVEQGDDPWHVGCTSRPKSNHTVVVRTSSGALRTQA
jgi:hypothetical protein